MRPPIASVKKIPFYQRNIKTLPLSKSQKRTETSYIININEEELINDISILPNVKAMAKESKDLGRETSFAIWSTEEEESYYYTKHYTHFIQEIEKNT